jgi:hypothetical protein
MARGGSHYGDELYLQARPFEEILMGNPTGNTGSGIYSGGSFGEPLQQYQQHNHQSNDFPGTLFQLMQQTEAESYPTLFSR